MFGHVLSTVFGELTQQIARGVVELGGYVDHQVHEEIAATAAVEVLDALVTNAMHRSVRAAGLDFDTRRAAKGRYLDFGPEHRLGVGNVRFVMEVITVSLEAFVGLDAQVHEEPTVASPAYSRRSTISETHRRTVLYARWNLDRER